MVEVRASIAELEAILKEGDEEVYIAPDGRVVRKGEAVTGVNSPTVKPEPTDADANELEEMRAQVWAAGATLEDSTFIARMLWRNGIRFHKVQMDWGMQLREPSLDNVRHAVAGQGEIANGEIRGEGVSSEMK